MKPTSVCKWDLEFEFKNEAQVREFFRLLMEQENLIYDFSCETRTNTYDISYTVSISGSWANNITTIAEILEKVDYKEFN